MLAAAVGSHRSNHFLIMTVVPVTEVELISIIGFLKNKNSSGYDGISNKKKYLVN